MRSQEREELRRESALLNGEGAELDPAAEMIRGPESRREFLEQSQADTLLRMQAGRLRTPADLAARVRRTIWRRQAFKVGAVVSGLAAVLCLAVAGGWLAHAVPAAERGPEAGTACNLLRVDPVARTVTMVICHPPNGQAASTEVRTFALAADCRVVLDGQAADVKSMAAGQPVTDYVVMEGSGKERLASVQVRR